MQTQQDIKSQLNGVSAKASNLAQQAIDGAKPMASQLSDQYENVREGAVEYYDFTMDYFKKHPVRSLATGAAIGLVAGFFLSRRSR